MKRILVVVVILAFASGCAPGLEKRFTVMTDPPDAVIRIVSGSDLQERTYTSPAEIAVRVPQHSGLASKNVMEVSRDAYKPMRIALGDIKEGDKLTIRLVKLVRYQLKCRLLSPIRADTLSFEDKTVRVSLAVAEQGFVLTMANLTSAELKVLWNQAEYTDIQNRSRKLMHSGVRHEDRNSLIPPQKIPPRGKLQQMIMPVASVMYSPEKKGYEVQPLFPLDTDAALSFKGKVFFLFIPVEYERQVIPYQFKVEIVDVVKVKG